MITALAWRAGRLHADAQAFLVRTRSIYSRNPSWLVHELICFAWFSQCCSFNWSHRLKIQEFHIKSFRSIYNQLLIICSPVATVLTTSSCSLTQRLGIRFSYANPTFLVYITHFVLISNWVCDLIQNTMGKRQQTLNFKDHHLAIMYMNEGRERGRGRERE